MTSYNTLTSGLANGNWKSLHAVYNILQKQCCGETDAIRAIKRRLSFLVLKLTTELIKWSYKIPLKLRIYV